MNRELKNGDIVVIKKVNCTYYGSCSGQDYCKVGEKVLIFGKAPHLNFTKLYDTIPEKSTGKYMVNSKKISLCNPKNLEYDIIGNIFDLRFEF